jgi:hypothetical protein
MNMRIHDLNTSWPTTVFQKVFIAKSQILYSFAISSVDQWGSRGEGRVTSHLRSAQKSRHTTLENRTITGLVLLQ